MAAGPANAKGAMDTLLVDGEGFLFGVKEPAGWTGDTTNAAKLSCNVAFYRKGQSFERAPVVIRVTIFEKTDEDISRDMKSDMDGYRDRYPGVLFRNMQAFHKRYRVLSKLFYISGDFFEYVTYLNPGPKWHHSFSASMYTGKKSASQSDLSAFKEVIGSLTMLAP